MKTCLEQPTTFKMTSPKSMYETFYTETVRNSFSNRFLSLVNSAEHRSYLHFYLKWSVTSTIPLCRKQGKHENMEEHNLLMFWYEERNPWESVLWYKSCWLCMFLFIFLHGLTQHCPRSVTKGEVKRRATCVCLTGSSHHHALIQHPTHVCAINCLDKYKFCCGQSALYWVLRVGALQINSIFFHYSQSKTIGVLLGKREESQPVAAVEITTYTFLNVNCHPFKDDNFSVS